MLPEERLAVFENFDAPGIAPWNPIVVGANPPEAADFRLERGPEVTEVFGPAGVVGGLELRDEEGHVYFLFLCPISDAELAAALGS